MRIIVFDTETNGLPKRYNVPSTDVDNWPRMTQLGFCVYENEQIVFEYQNHIIPDGWTVPKEAFWLDRGITTEFLQEHGIPVSEALPVLISEINACDLMVAHNVDFDYNIIGAEMIRSGLRADKKPAKFCTMKSSTDICKIPGQYGFKFPKLIELHFFLFGENFTDAHDALGDVKATGRCYFELYNKYFKHLQSA